MTTPDLQPRRLTRQQVDDNFSALETSLSPAEAAVEAGRCYFCYDAPCVRACPTAIDIPLFIRQIDAGNRIGAAATIFAENIMGGMCARVCPTEILCEQACVRNEPEKKPVEIGALQRFATDPVIEQQMPLFTRAAPTGKRVAVVGGGPAGLSCAHRLAVFGHEVCVFEARDKIAGLNEYGVAAYKAGDDIAQREAQYILSLGGISVKTGAALGTDVGLAELRADYDAVFLSLGLGATRQLGIAGEDAEEVLDAVDYIAELRQADDKSALPVGRRVVVIGGGMTAIDIALQSKLLGAEEVTIVYRRGQAQMGASEHEQSLAQTRGVSIRHWATPRAIHRHGDNGAVRAVEFAPMREAGGKLREHGERFTLDADVVFKAIGQVWADNPLGDGGAAAVEMKDRRIVVDEERRTSLTGVWAGGDCILDGDNLTVTAVQDGKLAAESIDRYLTKENYE